MYMNPKPIKVAGGSFTTLMLLNLASWSHISNELQRLFSLGPSTCSASLGVLRNCYCDRPACRFLMLNAKVYAYARLIFHHDLLLDVLKKRITEAISPAQLLAGVSPVFALCVCVIDPVLKLQIFR